MNTVFIKQKKPITGPFWPKKLKTNFLKKKKKKKNQSILSLYVPITSCTKLEKLHALIFHKT